MRLQLAQRRMHAARRALATVMALWPLAAAPAFAQRVAFPSPVAEGATTAQLPTVTTTPPAVAAPGAIAPAPAAAPLAPAVGQQFVAPPPPGTTAPVYAAPPPGTAPGAILPGTIGAPAPEWNVYGDPALQPPSLAPQQNYLNAPQNVWPYNRVRFLNDLRMQGTYLYGNNGKGADVEMTDVDLAATFAVPFFASQPPFLITPGFTFHFWDGPESSQAGGADLPAQLYDAYLDTAWRPQMTPKFGADLAFRIGVYSDFQFFDDQSLRFMGRALGVYTLSHVWQITAGIVYLDRNQIKLLPAGGLIWTPDPDTRYEIVFPYPKLAERLTTVGNTDWWAYVAGDYGGGAWTIEREDGTHDSFDYNDIRIRLGLEWMRYQGARGWFEVGYVFDREIVYEVDPTNFDPDDTFMLRAGVAY